jgi:glycosyltransferase involved in cell wall biosynthesis
VKNGDLLSHYIQDRRMKISIVTVAYNSGATIRDTIESVLAQDYPDIEHIIIDGDSRDATPAIVRAFGTRVARFVSEPDRGIYYAMNKGLDLASGDIVGFLNSDDMLEDPGCVSAIAACFSGGDIDAVYGDIVMVDPVQLHLVRRYWRPGTYRPGSCARGWMAPHPSLYVRRTLLQASGGFNTEYRLQSDFDLELRLFERMRIRTRYLPRTLVRMRMGGATTGSLRNILRGNLEAAKSAQSNGFPGGLRFIASKIVSRLPQYWTRVGKSSTTPPSDAT